MVTAKYVVITWTRGQFLGKVDGPLSRKEALQLQRRLKDGDVKSSTSRLYLLAGWGRDLLARPRRVGEGNDAG